MVGPGEQALAPHIEDKQPKPGEGREGPVARAHGTGSCPPAGDQARGTGQAAGHAPGHGMPCFGLTGFSG